jgi:hypothetical protein
MKGKEAMKTIYYAGLRVEVIDQMHYCSLISFKGRKFIVENRELVIAKALATAA